MYVPRQFAEEDTSACHDLIEANNFGLLVSSVDGAPFASHLPFMLHRERGRYGTLVVHMARANPQWRSFSDGGEVLSIFSGPHAYISPNWYRPGKSVPTWNYVSVHAYGVPSLLEEQPRETLDMMEDLVDAHEQGSDRPWRLCDQPADFLEAMVRGIVAMEIPITRLEGKAKLSQNRAAADRAGVIEALGSSDDQTARAVAALMRSRESG
ncbi:MAG: FMN-binding negative transcriptional regulator [Minwuiales bacterium]|nr:FMN-binding negative transcriptional regulator [Minwuiales bacterium]